VGVQCAVMAAPRFKTVAHQIEMFRFFICGFDPIVVKTNWHWRVGKTGNDILMKIDGIQFDMGDGMQYCDAAFLRPRFSAGHIAWV